MPASFSIEGGQTVVSLPGKSFTSRAENIWQIVQEDGNVVRKLTTVTKRGKAEGPVTMILPLANLVLRGAMADDQPVGDWTSECPRDYDSEDRPVSTHRAVVSFRPTEYGGKHFLYCIVKKYDAECPAGCGCGAICSDMSLSPEPQPDTFSCPRCSSVFYHGCHCYVDADKCKMFSCSIYLLPSAPGGCSVMTSPLFWQVEYEGNDGFIIPKLLHSELLLAVSLPRKDSSGRPLYNMKPVFSRKCLVCSYLSSV